MCIEKTLFAAGSNRLLLLLLLFLLLLPPTFMRKPVGVTTMARLSFGRVPFSDEFLSLFLLCTFDCIGMSSEKFMVSGRSEEE